jgi:hypothetical protein
MQKVLTASCRPDFRPQAKNKAMRDEPETIAKMISGLIGGIEKRERSGQAIGGAAKSV